MNTDEFEWSNLNGKAGDSRLKNIPTVIPNLFFIVEIEALGREGSHFLVQLIQIL